MRLVYVIIGGLAVGCGRSGEAPEPASPERSGEISSPPTNTTVQSATAVGEAPAVKDPCPAWPPPGASAKDALEALPPDAPRLALPDGGWVVVCTCRWPDGGERNWGANQDLVRIGPDGARLASIRIGMGRDGGAYWIEKPTLGLAGADPLEVVISGSYDGDAATARKVRRHVLLEAHAMSATVDTTCLGPMGDPSLREPKWFDEFEGGEFINFGSTGDETWGLKSTAKRVSPTCWRIDERWRSPTGVRAPEGPP